MLELQASCTTTYMSSWLPLLRLLPRPSSVTQPRFFLPEPVDTGRVLDGDRLAGVVDVAVLANPLVVASGLLL